MKPLLYDKTGTIKLGELNNCIECLVEEERNGLFEVSLIYPTNDTLFNSLEEENIIVCNANDTLLNQKFRIYMTRKLMSNRVEVFARHISFDLAYDYINNIDIKNQSCEYALNTIFRNSQFSTHYKGYSDIINAQDYKISKVNCIEAIGGTRGSIIDTFGTGAEILRDNTNIHVLNKRGHDNGVSIEYAKNLTGFELEEDYSELITRIIPFAKYSDSETNEEILVEGNVVDSDLISNYSHPYISYMDFSEKFGDEEIPTAEKLVNLAKKYFKNNNCDKPKQNFKIEFVPLSKCVGYEGIQDNISLCDTVTIKDTRYNIDTKAKVIKTVFNVLKNKYESMELGEPRTTLGDIINSSGGNGQGGEQGPPGPQGPPGQDGSVGDFPDTLPSTPVLSANVYGFANIELNWTYENKVYYNYELYGSKTKDFTPNTFDLVHAGQTSSYLFQAKPNETWYFRVCAVNTHGERTPFSSQVTVNTVKIDDLSNYVSDMAIGDALIDTLNLGRGWYGELKGNYIDAKQLSVTDGNGKRTLDIDSFGNIYGDFTKLSFNSIDVEESISNKGNMISNSNVLYTLDGFEPVGGKIKRYEKIQEEQNKEDVPVNNNPTIDGETNKPGDIPGGGVVEDIVDIPVITTPVTPPTTGINRTRIHFLLTVSCGDCILIQTDTGENILIDSVDGRVYDSTAPDSVTSILNYLDSLNISKIDYVICTHFHSDHAGGLDVIMNKYCDTSSKFFYKPIDLAQLRTNSNEVKWKTEQYYNNCLAMCEAKGIIKVNVASITRNKIDDNTEFVIYHKSPSNYNYYNDHSLVVVFKYKNKKVALMGDASPQVQYDLKDLIGKVDIVKDSHHGYNAIVNTEFIKTSNPKDVIVTRSYPFDSGYYRACNSVGMWQSYNKNIYTTFNSKNHIVVDFINNDYIINTSKKFFFENCWLKFNNDSSKWCYFKTGGNYAANETLVLEGKKYHFNSSGFCTNPY